MHETNAKTIALALVGIVIMSAGGLLISEYLDSTKILNRKVLASMPAFHLNGYPPETFQESPSNIYRYFQLDNPKNGQTLEVRWYADLILGMFIFSPEQFSYFQSVLYNPQPTENVEVLSWAKANNITYEAIGWDKEGIFSYNITKSGNLYFVLTNSMYGAAYASVQEFIVSLVSLQDQTYFLYIGLCAELSGILIVTYAFMHRKTVIPS